VTEETHLSKLIELIDINQQSDQIEELIEQYALTMTPSYNGDSDESD